MDWFPINIPELAKFSLPISLGSFQQGGLKDASEDIEFSDKPIDDKTYDTLVDRAKVKRATTRKRKAKQQRKTQKYANDDMKQTRRRIKKLRMRKTIRKA